MSLSFFKVCMIVLFEHMFKACFMKASHSLGYLAHAFHLFSNFSGRDRGIGTLLHHRYASGIVLSPFSMCCFELAFWVVYKYKLGVLILGHSSLLGLTLMLSYLYLCLYYLSDVM